MSTISRAIALLGALVCGIGVGSGIHVLSRSDQAAGTPGAPQHDEERSTESTDTVTAETMAPEKIFDRLHDALGQSDRDRRKRQIASLADELDGAQLREALQKLSASRIPNRKEVIAQLFSRWGELEPLAAMEFAKTLSQTSEQHGAILAALNGWMEAAPGAAEEWVRNQPNKPLKNAAWEAVITGYAADNPEQALHLANQVRLPWGMASNVAESIFAQWIMRDPATAADRVTALPKGHFRNSALETVTSQWAELDAVRALAWAESLPDRLPELERSFGGVLPAMPGADGTNTTSRILGTWIIRDPSSAIKWVSQLPDDARRMSAIADASWFNTERNHDPEIAVQLLNLVPEGALRDKGFTSITNRFCQIDPAAAINLLTAEKDESSRAMIMAGLASNLKGENLLAALNQGNGISFEQIKQWADPETAATWASQQSGNEKVLSQITGSWLVKDPKGAAEFVSQFPGPMKDAALSAGLDATLNSSPTSPQEMANRFERASGWIPEIADPVARQAAYQKLGERWVKIEPKSARSWIDSIPIPGELKTELLKNVPNEK